jgi:hypothetical protein
VGIPIMSFEEELELDNLLFKERKCRTCKIKKDLLNDFYLTRKNRKGFPSAYSYECKECTVNRIINSRKKQSQKAIDYQYPDW